MKSKDIFGLIVRVVGLFMAVSGISTACRWLHAVSAVNAFLFGIPYILVTVYLLRGAPKLIKFSYPEEQPPNAENQES